MQTLYQKAAGGAKSTADCCRLYLALAAEQSAVPRKWPLGREPSGQKDSLGYQLKNYLFNLSIMFLLLDSVTSGPISFAHAGPGSQLLFTLSCSFPRPQSQNSSLLSLLWDQENTWALWVTLASQSCNLFPFLPPLPVERDLPPHSSSLSTVNATQHLPAHAF